MNGQLFPKPKRRLKQPTKDCLRQELARSASTIERQAVTIEQQRIQIEHLRQPWWRRLLRKAA